MWTGLSAGMHGCRATRQSSRNTALCGRFLHLHLGKQNEKRARLIANRSAWSFVFDARLKLLILGTCTLVFLCHALPASAKGLTMHTGECKALRPVSDALVESGAYYVVARMTLFAPQRARGVSPYVAAFLLAGGPHLGDWKLLTGNADENHMTQVCDFAEGHGVRVRSEGRFWQERGARVTPASHDDFPGCKTVNGDAAPLCQTLVEYLRQPQRNAPVTLLLHLDKPSGHWLSLSVATPGAVLRLLRHGPGGKVNAVMQGMDFTWKPNLDQALAVDPLLPLDSVALRKGDAPALPPPARVFARSMETDDGNYDLDLFWTGPGIHPMADAARADQAHPPRAYEVQILNYDGSKVLDTLYTYRPFLKYLTARQRRVNTYVFEGGINLRIRTLGAGHLTGQWQTDLHVPIRRDYPYVVFIGGQSNVEAWFNHLSGKPRDREARVTFRQTIARSMGIPPYDVAVVNVSQGGSAVDRVARSTPSHYWYDLKKNQAGPLLTQALARMAKWKHVDLMVWAQGERETFATAMGEHYPGEARTSPARWQRATEDIFNRLRHTRETVPNMPIVFEGLGRLWYEGRQVNETVRNRYLARQVKLVRSQPDTWFGADASAFTIQDYEPLLPSLVHYGPGMYHILAKRMGRFVGRLLAGAQPAQSFPVITPVPAESAPALGGVTQR